MTKETKLILSCILIFLILFYFFEIVSAQNIKDSDTGFFAKIKNFAVSDVNKEKVNEFIQKTEHFLGFYLPSNFFGYFLQGLFAGFLIWLLDFIWEGIILIKKGKEALSKNRMYFKEGNVTWLNLIAGRIWKVPLIGIAFAVFMQIPIINRFLQLITLEILGAGFFWRSFALAFEIGFGPAIIEGFFRARKEIKYQKTAYEIQKLKLIAKQKIEN